MTDGVPKPGRQLLRRFGSQASLLVVVCAVLVVCGVIAGLAGQLMTAGAQRALSGATSALDSEPGSFGADVTTVLVTTHEVDGSAQPTADVMIPTIEDEVRAAAAPYDADVSSWAFGPSMFLAGDDLRASYLLDSQAAIDNAVLVSGKWPATTASGTAMEVALPRAAAEALGATLGDIFELNAHSRPGPGDPPPMELRLVGTFEANSSPAWKFDPLRGDGYSASLSGVPTYGPFVTAPGTFVERQMLTDRVATVLNPNLAGDPTHIPAMARHIAGLREHLTAELKPTVQYVIVRSGIGQAAAFARANQQISSALVLTVLLVVFAVGLAAVSLLARVLMYRRSVESTLLRDRGGSSRQLATRAAAEAGVLAVVAAIIAIPTVALIYRAAAGWDALGAEWAQAADSPLFTSDMIVATLAGTLIPASILVLASIATTARTRRAQGKTAAVIARSGIDLLLVALAALGYVQLRNHQVNSGELDPLLVIAPAACLLAGAALVSRLLPYAAKMADAVATRARGLAAPLAGWHISRGGAMRGSFLAVTASMLMVFGLVYLATWNQSQHDQAAAAVGADLDLGQAGGPTIGPRLAAVSNARAIPVTSRPIVLGTRPDGVSLLAVDAASAGEVLRGRLPGGETWQEATSALKPPTPSAPLVFTGDSLVLDVTGSSDVTNVSVTPTLVLEDSWGAITLLAGDEVPLDEANHSVELPKGTALPAGTWKVLAVSFQVSRFVDADDDPWSTIRSNAKVAVRVEGSTTAGTWDAQGDDAWAELAPGTVTASGDTVAASFSFVQWGILQAPATLTVTSFPVNEPAPLLLSSELAAAAGLKAGDRISLGVDATNIDAEVVGTLPYVPGHPRADAAMMDTEALARAMIIGGHPGSVTDAWWMSPADATTAQALTAQGLKPVTTIEAVARGLLTNPLTAPLKLAWALAITAALFLALVGVAAHAAAEAQQRAPTIARIRGIGVTRRIARNAHMAQHAIVTTAAIGAGMALGAVLAALLAPLLVVAEGGGRPVPAAVAVWPTVWLACVGAVLIVGSIAAGLPASRAVVRRSTVLALRSGELS